MIIANGLTADGLDDSEIAQLKAAGSALDSSVEFAIEARHARAALQQEQLQRLRDGANCPLIVLPAITSHAVGPDEVEEIASLLADQLSQLD